MKEDLVNRLTDFGLSVNQAKVYLSIIQNTATNVNAISKDTRIHRQDIYKILPILEEKGLVTTTVDRPIIIEAIPVSEALNNIILAEQQKAQQRITSLKTNYKKLANAIEKAKKQSETTIQEQEVQAIFLSTDRARKNRLEVSYENARTECDLVLNFELLKRRLSFLRKRFQTLAKNNVKTRLLIAATRNRDVIEKMLEAIVPITGDFTVNFTAGKVTVKPYLIIDCKELYAFTQKTTSAMLPCVLWTNSENVINIYKDNFEKNWSARAKSSSIPKKEGRKYERNLRL